MGNRKGGRKREGEQSGNGGRQGRGKGGGRERERERETETEHAVVLQGQKKLTFWPPGIIYETVKFALQTIFLTKTSFTTPGQGVTLAHTYLSYSAPKYAYYPPNTYYV